MIRHSPALDGLRGIAILLVLLHHFTILRPETAVGRSLTQLAGLGWAGVDLFFVLSGFLITSILMDSRASPRYFSSFYARRTLRIFPLYYLVAFVSLDVLPFFPEWHGVLAGDHPTTEWPYWTYLMNFAIATDNQFEHGILDVTWSLAIEEQFYLVWAAVVWLWPIKWLGWLCAAMMAGGPAARSWALDAGALPIDVYVLTPFRVDSLAAGAATAWLLRHGWVTAHGHAALVLSAVTLSGVLTVCLRDADTWWWAPSMQRVGYSLLALASAGLLIAAVRLPATHVWPRLLSARWLRAFGTYSYCLYLTHLPVMRGVRAFVLAPEEFAAFGAPWVGQVVFYAITTSISLGVAWLSWRFFEAPILSLKTRFPY